MVVNVAVNNNCHLRDKKRLNLKNVRRETMLNLKGTSVFRDEKTNTWAKLRQT